MPDAPDLMVRHLEIFACPACREPLKVLDDGRIQCTACERSFVRDRGIPLLFWPAGWSGGGDVTEIVKSFYRKHLCVCPGKNKKISSAMVSASGASGQSSTNSSN